MSFTLWFTGLPASGKTTLARLVYRDLEDKKIEVELLDSDDFVPNLGEYFDGSSRGRELNNRCLAIVCRFLNRHGIVCIAASTSPRIEQRSSNRRLIGNYIEVYCQCPAEIAERRDPKGLYLLARKRIIPGFTGIEEEYEAPFSPEITVDTGSQTEEQCMIPIMKYINLYMENMIGPKGRLLQGD